MWQWGRQHKERRLALRRMTESRDDQNSEAFVGVTCISQTSYVTGKSEHMLVKCGRHKTKNHRLLIARIQVIDVAYEEYCIGRDGEKTKNSGL